MPIEPKFITFDGIDGETNAAHPGANVEMTVKVLDAGGEFYGAMTDVDLAIRVTDTSTGHVTERESGLIYSGESGGLNESSTGVGGHYTQFMWDDTNAAAGDQLGKPKFEDIKLTMGVAGHDGDPGELTSDVPVAEGGYKMPDVLVTSWQSGDAPAGAGTDPIGPFFAYDASFRGGVDVPTASQGSGYAGQVDIASFGWGAETSAAEASGPMKESMETMKKAWKDASSTPEGAEHATGPFVAYGDGFMGGASVATSDAESGGSWTEHGTILTGNPPAADRPVGPFMGVYVGSGGAAPDSRLDVGTDVGVFEHGVIAGGGSWGIDRIDQRDLPSGQGSVFDASYELFV